MSGPFEDWEETLREIYQDTLEGLHIEIEARGMSGWDRLTEALAQHGKGEQIAKLILELATGEEVTDLLDMMAGYQGGSVLIEALVFHLEQKWIDDLES